MTVHPQSHEGHIAIMAIPIAIIGAACCLLIVIWLRPPVAVGILVVIAGLLLGIICMIPFIYRRYWNTISKQEYNPLL